MTSDWLLTFARLLTVLQTSFSAFLDTVVRVTSLLVSWFRAVSNNTSDRARPNARSAIRGLMPERLTLLSYLKDYARRGRETVFVDHRGLRTLRWSYEELVQE